MTRWAALVLVVSAGCGRVAFDPLASRDGGAAGDASDGGDSGRPDASVPMFDRTVVVKSSAPQIGALFGHSLALSRDGATLAVGVPLDANDAGSVLVFRRSGDVWAQDALRVIPTLPEVGDQFGWSVGISDDGNTLVVGARREDSGLSTDPSDNSAMSAGAAYVFTWSGSTWMQRAYLKATMIASGDSFGERVAISGDGTTIAVGAPQAIGVAGSVSMFDGAGGVWTPTQTLKASNTGGGDEFGYRLAVSQNGDMVVVSAYREDSSASGVFATPVDNALTNSGAAYVFTGPAGALVEALVIKASNPDIGDNFGYGVAVSRDAGTVAITAEGESGPANGTIASGAMYLFDTMPWAEVAIVRASNGQANDELGYCVSIADGGDLFATGAVFEDGVGEAVMDSGAVYVTTRDLQQRYLKAPTPGPGDWFGWSCALSGAGDVIAIGAPYEDTTQTDSGAVYIFY